MNQQTAKNLMYAEHDRKWAPPHHDPHGRVTYPPKPERCIFDKMDALNFVPKFGIAIKAKGKHWENSGPSAGRFCPECEMHKIAAKITNGVPCCITCGTELEILY
jgi:hypothetical protein